MICTLLRRAHGAGPEQGRNPYRGWRGVLPRHPQNSTCVQPSVRGIRVASLIAWLQQKQRLRLETAQPLVGAGLLAMASARFNSNTAPLASRASPLPQRRCASLADLAGKQAGRSAASAGIAVDLPAPSGGRVEVLRSGSPGMDAGARPFCLFLWWSDTRLFDQSTSP